MSIDVSATIAGLTALGTRVNVATERIVDLAAHAYQAQSMINAPVGETGNSTNAPDDLRRSIQVDGPSPAGADEWVAWVGPTVVTAHPGPGGTVYNYGRQREFGGDIVPRVSRYLVFQIHGVWARKLSVFQQGSHYLGRARATTPVDGIIVGELTVAVS